MFKFQLLIKKSTIRLTTATATALRVRHLDYNAAGLAACGSRITVALDSLGARGGHDLHAAADVVLALAIGRTAGAALALALALARF